MVDRRRGLSLEAEIHGLGAIAIRVEQEPQ
jgi:hypothetical protein